MSASVSKLPSPLKFSELEIVSEHVLVVRLNRPKQLNSLHPLAHAELSAIWDHYHSNPNLWVAILTGNGAAFSAGFDLQFAATQAPNADRDFVGEGPKSGFGGLVLRQDLAKPIIAAVNGIAFGGGFELALACDIVIASEKALFSLPEPKVGLAALAGGLARLPRVVGLHNAMGMILTAKRVSPQEGYRLGFVNEVVPHENLMKKALEYANMIMDCSPDSIRASKRAVLLGLTEPNVVQAINKSQKYPEVKEMLGGDNLIEGILAFNQKRKPEWKSSL